jgi:serine/threonine protein kinase
LFLPTIAGRGQEEDSYVVGQTISHYQILEKLGQGGMGVVYKAQDLKLDRFVALKFLPPHLEQSEEEKARFIQEAKAASALDHPNICAIHEIDETADGQIFIAMGFYEGETLKKKVSSNQLSVDSVIDIAIQIAQGLAKAHLHGIVHRDIKPVNVMITKDGAAKILDFGLAKCAGQTRLTKTGTTVGTPAYMSPEQINLIEVDHRTDIGSLGVVLYEMITGHLPFRGEYEAALIYSIVNEKPEPLARYKTGVSEGLQHIIDKALDKERETRYQHVDDLLADLKRERKSSSSSVKPSATIKESPSKKKLWMSLGAFAVLAIIATVLVLLPQRRPELNPNMTFRILPIPFTQIWYPGLSQDGTGWRSRPPTPRANGRST